MKKIPAKTSLANDLANTLIRDVRDRGLKEGDRYYTTEEAGHKFSVSKETARKAMQILAGRDVLVRLQRRGTFVGSMASAQSQPQTTRRQILILSLPVPYPAPPIEATQLPHFLAQAMEDMFIQDHLIPSDEDVSVIARVIEAAKTTGRLDGVVFGSRTREVHEYLASLGIPIVFLGTLDSSQPDLPMIDLDYHEAGRLLAEHLIARGHRLMVVQLFTNCRGDHVFADSIVDVMSAASLPPNSLRIRTFNGDYQTARANLGDLLRSDNRPTAIITRGRMLADTAAAAAEDAGLCVGKDIEIVWSSNALRVNNENSAYVNVQPKLTMNEVASLIADMLRDQQVGKTLKERNVLIPAELCKPSKKSRKKRS